MEPRQQRQTASDNTAERSWKIWVKCGEKLLEQYKSGLMPPPPRALRGCWTKVRKMGGMEQLCNAMRHRDR
jgi:hypothetical protein